MIKGIGVDIVLIERFERQKDKGAFLSQILTDEEMLGTPDGDDQDVYYAKIFAAKEAVLKALGCGLRSGSLWHDIVVRGGSEVRLSGRIRCIAEEQSISNIHLSHSSSRTFVVAIVLCDTNNPEVTA